MLKLFLIVASLGVATEVMATDRVPTLDVRPSCKAAATMGGEGGRTVESCLRSEQTNRDQLAKEWDQFAAADRTRCVQATAGGFEPTYTELLTCLEMARDTKVIERQQAGDKAKRP